MWKGDKNGVVNLEETLKHEAREETLEHRKHPRTPDDNFRHEFRPNSRIN